MTEQDTACLKGNHQLLKIYSKEIDMMTDEVVSWCVHCGGITVDLEVDGRLNANIRKMVAPVITCEHFTKLRNN